MLSVSSSSWCLGRAAVCDFDTPWTFLLPFFSLVYIKLYCWEQMPPILKSSDVSKTAGWVARSVDPEQMPLWGDSNEYTQHTFKIKNTEKISHNYLHGASWCGTNSNRPRLELPLSWTHFHGPKGVPAIEVRLYNCLLFVKGRIDFMRYADNVRTA